MISQTYICKRCGKTETVPYTADPVCCLAPMTPGKLNFPEGDTTKHRLHLLKLLRDPVVEWQMAVDPNRIYELWQLRRGMRRDGEFLGWIGERETCVEWVMPKGVAIRGGFAPTIEDAVANMLHALEGGVHASKNIESVLV